MQLLASYLSGSWSAGSGSRTTLVNPATEAALAEVSAGGHDLAGAVRFARETGARELGTLTFAQRGALLAALAKAVSGAREELIALAVANGGNTRSDAKFDVDGGGVTLQHYAELGARLGSVTLLADGEPIQVGRTARMGGQHVWTRRRGVAVHINAFNFPGWGLCEKLGPALLAGMPVITKPATATALVAHRLVELFAPLLPAGALQLLVGPAGTLLDHCGPGDVVAFTGGSATARTLRSHPKLVEHGVRINIEADSLNAAILGPDVELTSEAGALFLADVTRDMTQKTGQKCTATRRVFVPRAHLERVQEDLREQLAAIKVGDPALEEVRMGPLASAQQLAAVRAGIDLLEQSGARIVHGSRGKVEPLGVPAGKGYFVSPVLLRADDPHAARAVHEHEVFGPVATLMPYEDVADAARLVALGKGGLVTSVYTDDRAALEALVLGLAPWSGRILCGSSKIADQATAPGLVLPSCVHGGPGRAGGGEELGGERGLDFYMQRTALQGDRALLARALGLTLEPPAEA